MTTYALTVENGTVNGGITNEFVAGATVSISADPAPTGYHFLNWTSTAGGTFSNSNAAETTFTMPANPTTITANYEVNKPTGLYVVIDISGGPTASFYPLTNLDDVPVSGWTDEYKVSKLVLRRISAGTFLMGSSINEVGRRTGGIDYDYEKQHIVNINQDFLSDDNEDSAVNRVGRYAHNGGALSGNSASSDTSGELGTAFVGSYEPNQWGLYDFHGNVNEWCADWYDENYYYVSPATNPMGPNTGSYRVCRGGSYYTSAASVRSAWRNWALPGRTAATIGFRISFIAGSQ